MNVSPVSARCSLLAAAALSVLLACVVPSVDEVSAACDLDAGHGCGDGFVCVDGACVATGDDCSAGQTRPCGSNEGACKQGTQSCSGGAWSECVGGIGPDATTFYRDQDGDGHGDPANAQHGCVAPAGYVASNDDCDDAHAEAHPGGSEVCDGLDNDCNGSTDDGIAEEMKPHWYQDEDADGHGTASATVRACSQPVGYVASDDDCNDGDATVHPGATETCNAIDDDCNGSTDEGVLSTFYKDDDGDGYGLAATSVSGCAAPMGYVSDSSDCDDTRAAVHPGAPELCDGDDNDCNGTVDDPPEVALVTTANAATTSLAWTAAGQGFSALYSEPVGAVPHLFFKRFGADLSATGAPVDLSAPAATQSTVPAIAAVPSSDDVIAVWVDQVAGSQRVLMARVDAAGNLVWTGTGGTPTRILVAAPASITSAGARVAISGGAILVAWNDQSAHQVRASTFDLQGNVIATPALIGGLGTEVEDLDVEAYGSTEFAVATNALSSSVYETRVRRFDKFLAPVTNANVFTANGPVSEIDLVSDASAPSGLVAAWVEQKAGKSSLIRAMNPFAPGPSGQVMAIVGPTPDLIGHVSGFAPPTGGAAFAFAQGQSPSVVNVQGAQPTAVTSSATSSFGPAVTGLGTLVPFVVGYEQDRGQSLDLYARILCSP